MVYVKIEPRDDAGPAPPWAAPRREGPPWAVEVKREPGSGEPLEIRPEPERPEPAVLTVDGVTIVKEEEPAPPKPAPAPGRDPARALLAHPYQAPAGGHVSSRNYLAVEAHGEFGLVDRGAAAGGLHDLLAHAPRRAGGRLAALRVGDTFDAVARGGGAGQQLRVRYLTPAKYYPPGRRVTMLGVGVDERAWQRLVVKPPAAP